MLCLTLALSALTACAGKSEPAAEENEDVFANMQGQNTIVTHADFVAANS